MGGGGGGILVVTVWGVANGDSVAWSGLGGQLPQLTFLFRVHVAAEGAAEGPSEVLVVPGGAQDAVLVGAVLVRLQAAEEAGHALVATPQLGVGHEEQLAGCHGNQTRQSHTGIFVLLRKQVQGLRCACVCVRACVRACVRGCVRACVCVCVCVCMRAM